MNQSKTDHVNSVSDLREIISDIKLPLDEYELMYKAENYVKVSKTWLKQPFGSENTKHVYMIPKASTGFWAAIDMGFVPREGTVQWTFSNRDLYNTVKSTFVQDALERLKRMPQLAEISTIRSSANYSRYIYFTLAIRVISTTRNSLKQKVVLTESTGFSLRAYEIIEMWFLLSQVGHLFDGYQADRFLMWRINKDNLVEKLVQLFETDQKDWVRDRMKSLDYTQFNRIILQLKINRTLEKEYHILHVLIKALLDCEDKQQVPDDLYKCYCSFRKIRELVILQLDSSNVDIGVNIKASQLVNQINLFSFDYTVSEYTNPNISNIPKNLSRAFNQYLYFDKQGIAAKCSLLQALNDEFPEINNLEQVIETLYTRSHLDKMDRKLTFAFFIPLFSETKPLETYKLFPPSLNLKSYQPEPITTSFRHLAFCKKPSIDADKINFYGILSQMMDHQDGFYDKCLQKTHRSEVETLNGVFISIVDFIWNHFIASRLEVRIRTRIDSVLSCFIFFKRELKQVVECIREQMKNLDHVRTGNLDIKKVKEEITGALTSLEHQLKNDTEGNNIILFALGSLDVSTASEVISENNDLEFDGFWCKISKSQLDLFIIEEKNHELNEIERNNRQIDAKKKARGQRQLKSNLSSLGKNLDSFDAINVGDIIFDGDGRAKQSVVTVAHITAKWRQ